MTETAAKTQIEPAVAKTMEKHSLSMVVEKFLCGEVNHPEMHLENEQQIDRHKNPKIAENAIGYGKVEKVTPNPEQIRAIIEQNKSNFYSN